MPCNYLDRKFKFFWKIGWVGDLSGFGNLTGLKVANRPNSAMAE